MSLIAFVRLFWLLNFFIDLNKPIPLIVLKNFLENNIRPIEGHSSINKPTFKQQN